MEATKFDLTHRLIADCMPQEYRFDGYTLDTFKLQLKKDEIVVCQDERIINALHLLANAYPKAVDKDTLLRVVWPNQIVTEFSLSKLISDIRQILGDDGKTQRIIKTERGKGFRIICPVAAVSLHEENHKYRESQNRIKLIVKKKWVVLIAVFLVLLILAFRHYQTQTKNSGVPIVNSDIRLGTIPVLVNTSNAEDEWIKLGISSLLVGHLGQYQSISVIPMDSIFKVMANIKSEVDTNTIDKTKVFNQVCSKVGCTHLIYLIYTENDTAVELQYELFNAEQVVARQSFQAHDVLEAFRLLTQHLDKRLLAVNSSHYSFADRYSSNDLSNRSYAIAISDLYNGNLPEAIVNFNLAIARDPSFFYAKISLANALILSAKLENAREILESIDVEKMQSPEMLGILYQTFSQLNTRGGDQDQASLFSERAMVEFVKLDDRINLAREQANYAGILLSKFLFYEAQLYYEKAIKYFSDSGDTRSLATIYYNAAELQFRRNKNAEALHLFQKSWELSVINDLGLYVVANEFGIARSHLELGKYDGLQEKLLELAEKFKMAGISDFYYGCKASLVELDIKREQLDVAEENIQKLIVEMADISRIPELDLIVWSLATKIQFIKENYREAEKLYKKMEGDYYYIDPQNILIGAEIAYNTGDRERAVEIALSVKDKLGSNWTDAHQAYLEKYYQID